MLQDREQRSRIIAGVVIILLGVMALINNAVEPETAAWLWIIVMVVAAVIFGWAYMQEKETWFAIGAYLTGAIALLVFLLTKTKLDESELSDVWVPAIVLLGIALPFVVAWWVDRTRWGLLIPAYILVAIIPILLISETTEKEGDLVPAYVMLVIGVPFIGAYLLTRKWGFLVPGGIMILIGLAFLGTSVGLSEQVLTVIVPIVLIAIGAFMLFRARTGLPQKRE